MQQTSDFSVSEKTFCVESMANEPSRAGIRPVGLQCEFRVEPSGIDEKHPGLTWRLVSNTRGEKQAGYRIIVASSAELIQDHIGDLWDSGVIDSNKTINILYAGKPLHSRMKCFWKVCAWGQDGKSQWSDLATWTMGLLNPEDWSASFISFPDTTPLWKGNTKKYLPPARQYRREFSAEKEIRRATIYATALGIYELHMNGARVGEARFAPGWTDYRQRSYYHTFDVTPMIKQGNNALGAWVADGWYSGYIGFGMLKGLGTEQSGRNTYGKTPALMVQLEIEYTDGSREIVVTDKSWKQTADGPIREADFLMGEYYDARREMADWDKPGFNDASWEPVILASENGDVSASFYEYQNPASINGFPKIAGHQVNLGFRPPAVLQAFPGADVKALQEIRPMAVTSPTGGVYIFDLGQNFAGIVRLKVNGPAGTTVQLRYGEMLHPDGRLMTENLRTARAMDVYVLRGDPKGEIYEPRFTYHGFQYVEITGYPGIPDEETIRGIVLQSDTALTSFFECSDQMANRLFKNVVWTQRANFIDLPTDCPQRDERLGWMGDAQIYAHCATLNANVAAFFRKWLREVMSAQRPSGVFPDFCPYPFQTEWDFSPAWCDAGIICPWHVWQAYGDERVIHECWPFMVKFMEWRQQVGADYLGKVHGNFWGDWLSFGPETPLDYIDTVYFAHTADLISQMAVAIGKNAEAGKYGQLSEKIRAAFCRKYLKSDGSLIVDSQTAYALAIYMDLIPADLRLKSGKILADKLRDAARVDNSGMTTGFLGTRPLLPALTSVGENDLAVKLFQSRKFPSWGYEVDQGATTIWERWNSYTKDNGFDGKDGKQNASMNSFSHYSFGAVCEWMLNDLAGIQTDGSGYDRIIIHPHPPTLNSNKEHPPISWVKAHYDSIRGRILSNWRHTASAFELETMIPPNTSALVYIPAFSINAITESGIALGDAVGINSISINGDIAEIGIDSGHYRFRSDLSAASAPNVGSIAAPMITGGV